MRTKKRLAAFTAAMALAGSALLPSAYAESANNGGAVSASPANEGFAVDGVAAGDAAAAGDSASVSDGDAAGDGAASSEGAAAVNEEPPADIAVSKEKAESLARQLVSIPKEYLVQHASYSSEQLSAGKRGAWDLYFVKKENGKTKGSVQVRVGADDGKLLAFDHYDNDPNAKPSYPLKVEREAAKDIALGFIGEHAADYKDQLRFDEEYGARLLPPLTGEVRHALRFNRVVNGVPFEGNFVTVDVDSEGHVVGYRLQWDGTIVFPDGSPKLTAEQASAKLTEVSGPRLAYILPFGGAKAPKPILGYLMDSGMIDAATGEPVKDAYPADRTVSSSPVAEKALGEKPKAGNLTEAQAIDAVKRAFGLPDGAQQVGSSYNESTEDYTGRKHASWNLNWRLKNGNGETGYAYATVDSAAGTVQSYHFDRYDNGSTSANPKLSYEEAAAKAAETVRKQLPWAAHELYAVRYENVDPDQPVRSYYVSFVHKVNGAEIGYDNVSVEIDAQSGAVVGFDASISDFDYPDAPPSVIPAEEAALKWMTYYRTELTYYQMNRYWIDGRPIPAEKYKVMAAAGELGEGAEVKPEVKLVYRLVPRPLDESVFVNAETGEWASSETGEPAQLEKPVAEDIDGHWAERELSLMVAYKALDIKDGKVRPNETVTRGELIKMLVLSMNGGNVPFYGEAAASKASFDDVAVDSGYFKYVESAVRQNLIDIGDGSFNPDGKVSREDMAELIVRALGYNALANYGELFHVSFADGASVERKGQAAIVVGLGIMSLDGGKFVPDREVTRAEASAAFFRFLQTRAELKEAPLRD